MKVEVRGSFEGGWSPLEEEIAILWLRCLVDCEDFDRRLPGRMAHGEWMPNCEYMGTSRKFASEHYSATKAKVWRIAWDGRLPKEACEAVRREVSKLGHEEQSQLLAALLEQREPPEEIAPR